MWENPTSVVAMVGGGWLRLFLFYLLLTTDHLTNKKKSPFGEKLKLSSQSILKSIP